MSYHLFKKTTLKILSFALFLSIFLSVSSFPLQASDSNQNLQKDAFSLYPILTTIQLKPGSSTTKILHAVNTANAPLSFQVQINQFVSNGNNENITFLPPDKVISGYLWIHAPATLTLLAHEVKDIPIQIEIPNNSSGISKNYSVSLQEIPAQLSETHILRRLHALFFITAISKMPAAIFVTNLKQESSFVIPFSTNGIIRTVAGVTNNLTFTFDIENKNAFNVVPNGELLFMAGKKITAFPLALHTILPNSIRHYAVRVPLHTLPAFIGVFHESIVCSQIVEKPHVSLETILVSWYLFFFSIGILIMCFLLIFFLKNKIHYNYSYESHKTTAKKI